METSVGKVAEVSLDFRVEREEEGMEILKGVTWAMMDTWNLMCLMRGTIKDLKFRRDCGVMRWNDV